MRQWWCGKKPSLKKKKKFFLHFLASLGSLTRLTKITTPLFYFLLFVGRVCVLRDRASRDCEITSDLSPSVLSSWSAITFPGRSRYICFRILFFHLLGDITPQDLSDKKCFCLSLCFMLSWRFLILTGSREKIQYFDHCCALVSVQQIQSGRLKRLPRCSVTVIENKETHRTRRANGENKIFILNHDDTEQISFHRSSIFVAIWVLLTPGALLFC